LVNKAPRESLNDHNYNVLRKTKTGSRTVSGVEARRGAKTAEREVLEKMVHPLAFDDG
jgi:hypothetical protein